MHMAASSGSAGRHQPPRRRQGRRQREGIRSRADAADLRRRPQSRRGDQGAARARRRCRRSTTKVIDIAEVQRARSRRRRSAAQGASRASSARNPKSQGDAQPGRGRDRSGPRDRALGQDSAARSERAAVDPNVRNFNPEEINPPVATKGGMTALLHAARQGYLESADRAARRRRQHQPGERRRRHEPAAHADHQRPVRHGHAADQARRRSEHHLEA